MPLEEFEVVYRREIRFWRSEGPMRGPGRLGVGPEGLRLEGRRVWAPWLVWPLGAFMFWFLRTGLILVWLVVQYGLLRRTSLGVSAEGLSRVVRDARSGGWRVEVRGSAPFHFRLRDAAEAARLEEALKTLGRPVETGPVALDRPEILAGVLVGVLVVSLVGTLTLG